MTNITRLPERELTIKENEDRIRDILWSLGPPAQVNVEAEIQNLVSAVTRLTRVFDGKAKQQMKAAQHKT